MQTPPLPYILGWEDRIFLIINHLPHNPITDALALTLSGVGAGGIIWFLLGLWLFVREKKKDTFFLLSLLIAGSLSWLIVNIIFKPLISRPRPPLDYLGGILVGNLLSDFSFPSGHATIAWAMAVILSRYEPRWRGWFYLLAVLISFSRIYLGVHYPLDVVGGAFLGWIIGSLCLRIPGIIKK